MAYPNVTEEENCTPQSGSLKVLHIMFFSQNGFVLDHPVPVGTKVSGQYYYTLQDKMRPAVCHKQPLLLQHGVILLQDSATRHHHCDVQHWG
jgi:Transposase.